MTGVKTRSKNIDRSDAAGRFHDAAGNAAVKRRALHERSLSYRSFVIGFVFLAVAIFFQSQRSQPSAPSGDGWVDAGGEESEGGGKNVSPGERGGGSGEVPKNGDSGGGAGLGEFANPEPKGASAERRDVSGKGSEKGSSDAGGRLGKSGASESEDGAYGERWGGSGTRSERGGSGSSGRHSKPDGSEPKGDRLEPKDGAGCRLLVDGKGPSSWVTRGKRSMNLNALPPGARPFICYDGRAFENPNDKPFLADTAVVLVENFLLEAEVEHFRNLAQSHARPSSKEHYTFANAIGQQYDGSDGQRYVKGLADPERLVYLRNDTLLNRLEERIAAVVGVPASGQEGPLQLAIEGAASRTSASVPNVHHDKSRGLVRHVTVILYLTTPGEGGETLFPALPSPAAAKIVGVPPKRPPAMQRYAAEFSKIMTKLIKSFSKISAESHRIAADVEVEKGTPLQQELATLCPADATLAGGATSDRPLAVRPVPGRAIVFWHEAVGTDFPLLDVFHGGCPVRLGTKISLQKFKSFAPGTAGCKRSKWCHSFTPR